MIQLKKKNGIKRAVSNDNATITQRCNKTFFFLLVSTIYKFAFSEYPLLHLLEIQTVFHICKDDD